MTSSFKPALTKSLRFTALFGTIISTILFSFFKNPHSENQVYSYYGLLIVVTLVLFSSLILRKYVLQVLKNIDLLVPAGLFLTISSAMSFFIKASAETITFTGLPDFKLINFQLITFQLIISILFSFFNTVLFVGWTTKLLLNFAKLGKADLLLPFEEIMDWLPKTLFLLVLKFVFAVFFILIFLPFLVFSAGSLPSRAISFYLLIPVIGLIILLINLTTAVILSHLLNSKINFFSALREGIKISWANKSRTVLPVILLLICCGWITFIRVNYRKASADATEFGSSLSYQSSAALKISFNFNNVWVATYPHESFWHTQLLKAVEEESFELNEFRIALLILFLAVVVNLTIIKVCLPRESETAFEKNDGQKALSKESVLVIASLILCFLPVEKLIRNLSPATKSGQVPLNAQIVSGQDNFKKELIFETGKGGTVEIKQDKNSNETAVRHISNLIVKDFKDGSGPQLIASTGAGAVFLDSKGELKRSVPIEIIKTKETENDLNTFYFSQKIVEINEKGDLGLVSYKGYSLAPGIFDFKGKMILPFAENAGTEKTVSVFTGDVDRNGIDELYEFSSDRLQKLDLTKKRMEKFVFTPDSIVFKRNDELNLLNSKQSIVTNSKGEQIQKISKPIRKLGYFSDENGQPKSLFLTANQLGIFELSGRLSAKYAAPLTEPEGEYSNEFPEMPRFLIYEAEAQRFTTGGKINLAVIANLSDAERSLIAMFYIYDDSGRIIYQEVINDLSPQLAVLPAADSNNGDSLLIYTGNKIWKYTKQ